MSNWPNSIPQTKLNIPMPGTRNLDTLKRLAAARIREEWEKREVARLERIIAEGEMSAHTDKGGHNIEPSQVTERPPSPAPLKPMSDDEKFMRPTGEDEPEIQPGPGLTGVTLHELGHFDNVDRVESAEQKAYRRGKAAGYDEGVIHGWEQCVRQVKAAVRGYIDAEPLSIRQHRHAVQQRQGDSERER